MGTEMLRWFGSSGLAKMGQFVVMELCVCLSVSQCLVLSPIASDQGGEIVYDLKRDEQTKLFVPEIIILIIVDGV